ncbi:MAG TPA: imidazole glycerol phosphate synthase cyclase subunit [bacterium]|nr:imidazole glycerol phosphate synthase cyclase subunit [bacterium]HQP97092.1 imidazole glycerol phosphate synthase cyclase subunit [bacterium]
MLKTRIIPVLLFKRYGLVKGISFDSWRRVGTSLPAVKVYCEREVDELVFLDIAATPEGRTVDVEEVDHLADECFMPLTVGGGIRRPEDVRAILRAGAEKVSINTGALENPGLIDEVSRRYGRQCIVISIDVKRHDDGRYEVFSHCGTQPTGRCPEEWAREAAERGGGEILLTSIDRDGTMEGYDIALTRRVSDVVDIPVIAAGGAGSSEHIYQVLTEGGANAAAAASIFHFTQQTPREAKQFLASRGIHVRL